MLDDPRVGVASRRDLFRMGALAAVGSSGALVSGCGQDGDDGRDPAARDRGLLNRSLKLEHAAVAAYVVGLELVDGSDRRLLLDVLAQERAHVRSLAREISRLGGNPAAARQPAEYRRGFPTLRSSRDVLRFAVDLEYRVIRSYVDGVMALGSSELRQLSSAIATNEAEHVSLLLDAAGKDPLPEPFVTGT
jgi:rubrerythrin